MIVPGLIEIKIHLEVEGERTMVVLIDVTSEIFGKCYSNLRKTLNGKLFTEAQNLF